MRSSEPFSPVDSLCTGDLIFVPDTTGMGRAISQSTGCYTHVAVAVRDSSALWIYEALPRQGVIRTQARQWFAQFGADSVSPDLQSLAVFRLDQAFDSALLRQRLSQSLGKPYDAYFLPDNGMFYCSELISESFFDTAGRPIFAAQPMNFMTIEGLCPEYWQRHFDSLGIAIPQGTPGTNPTDMSRNPHLRPRVLTPHAPNVKIPAQKRKPTPSV